MLCRSKSHRGQGLTEYGLLIALILGILVLVVPTIGLGYGYINSSVSSAIDGAIGGSNGGNPTPTPTSTLTPTPTPMAPIAAGTDLALGGTASALRGQYGDQAADLVKDGNDSTYYQVQDMHSDGWVEIDLGAAYSIGAGRVYQFANRATGFDIQYSTDGADWSNADVVTGAAADWSGSFSPITARYWRMLCTTAVDWWTLSTFSLFAA